MAGYGVPQGYGGTVAATGAAESQTLYFDPAEDDDFETGQKAFVVVQTMVSIGYMDVYSWWLDFVAC